MSGLLNSAKTVRYASLFCFWGGVGRLAARFGLSLSPIARRAMLAKHAPDRLFVMWLRIAAGTLALAANAQSAGEYTRILAGEGIIAASVDDAYCDTDSGNDSPVHRHHNHAQCCILCNAVGHDFISHTTKAIFDLTYDLKSATNFFIVYAALNGSDPRALGWASSWSSRAPPAFF